MALGKQHGVWFHVLDILFNLIVIAAIVAGIRTFLVSPFQVEGTSMNHTLEDSEYIIINKLAYFIGTPKRGDIVVFRPPNDDSKYYVKRVIGIPGDSVILRGGNVYLIKAGTTEAIPIQEPYLDPENQGHTYRTPLGKEDPSQQARYDVPADRYFLLGDNRKGSSDSRSFQGADGKPSPFVERKEIKGKVWFVALPISKIHVLEHYTY